MKALIAFLVFGLNESNLLVRETIVAQLPESLVGRTSQIPLLPCVEVQVGGATKRLLIDTSSSMTWMKGPQESEASFESSEEGEENSVEDQEESIIQKREAESKDDDESESEGEEEVLKDKKEIEDEEEEDGDFLVKGGIRKFPWDLSLLSIVQMISSVPMALRTKGFSDPKALVSKEQSPRSTDEESSETTWSVTGEEKNIEVNIFGREFELPIFVAGGAENLGIFFDGALGLGWGRGSNEVVRRLVGDGVALFSAGASPLLTLGVDGRSLEGMVWLSASPLTEGWEIWLSAAGFAGGRPRSGPIALQLEAGTSGLVLPPALISPLVAVLARRGVACRKKPAWLSCVQSKATPFSLPLLRLRAGQNSIEFSLQGLKRKIRGGSKTLVFDLDISFGAEGEIKAGTILFEVFDLALDWKGRRVGFRGSKPRVIFEEESFEISAIRALFLASGVFLIAFFVFSLKNRTRNRRFAPLA